MKKMSGKTERNNQKNDANWHTRIAVAVFVILGLLLARHFILQIAPVKETIRSEQHKVPKNLRAQLLSPAVSYKVPILLYHYVEYVTDKNDTTRESLNIKPNAFEAQIKTLKDNGYTFLTASELGSIIDGKMQMPPKPVLITIDDGHWDVDTVILPILQKYHARATAYIITGFIGRSDFMTHDQLVDVISSGLVEIGAHTVDHVSLKGLFPPIVTYEVSQSRKDLKNEYKLNVVSFAYPNGAFDEQAIEIVKAAGFTNAVSTIPGDKQSDANKFFLFRIRPGYRTGQELIDYLSQDNYETY
jgi:peptidoglycan/xylan/chitin deacetylase (PgdA/CDA1 family)